MSLLPTKAVRQEIVENSKKFISLSKRVIGLVEKEQENTADIKRLKDEVTNLKDEVKALQNRGGELLARAELSAARAISDLARRIGYFEGRSSRD
jgi:predicted nuclease with TOPRIM domain